MPGLAIFGPSAQIRDRQDTAGFHPAQKPQGLKLGVIAMLNPP